MLDLGTRLLQDFATTSTYLCGRALAITHIGISVEDALGFVAYQVGYVDEPIILLTGERVREVAMSYDLEDISSQVVN